MFGTWFGFRGERVQREQDLAGLRFIDIEHQHGDQLIGGRFSPQMSVYELEPAVRQLSPKRASAKPISASTPASAARCEAGWSRQLRGLGDNSEARTRRSSRMRSRNCMCGAFIRGLFPKHSAFAFAAIFIESEARDAFHLHLAIRRGPSPHGVPRTRRLRRSSRCDECGLRVARRQRPTLANLFIRYAGMTRPTRT